MAIAESDISILIPTFRYRDKVVRAVESALASKAGEIIVTDDRGQDGTIERLAGYSDPRLKVTENERNLGLWENHLHALGLATKPWIKFIQADDYLLPDGLAAYANGASEGVTVVWSVPTVKDDETGKTWRYHDLSVPRRLRSQEMLRALLYGGWILGSPSHMMLRSDAIERDPAVWRTRISADLAVGTIAAARGDTVLLPAGAIGDGVHPLQDGKTQSISLALARRARTLDYLRQRPEPDVRRFANLWSAIYLKSYVRIMMIGLVRGAERSKVLREGLALVTDMSMRDWREVLAANRDVRGAMRFQKSRTTVVDLDSICARVAADIPGLPA